MGYNVRHTKQLIKTGLSKGKGGFTKEEWEFFKRKKLSKSLYTEKHNNIIFRIKGHVVCAPS